MRTLMHRETLSPPFICQNSSITVKGIVGIFALCMLFCGGLLVQDGYGSTEYSSTDVPKTIISGPYTSTLTISDTGTITDLNVKLNISHTYDSDLDVFLIGPDATRVELFTDVGGSGDNFSNTILDDEASVAITSGSAPFTGSYYPEGNLSDFYDKGITGIWTLEITDDYPSADNGTLNSWSLLIETNGGGGDGVVTYHAVVCGIENYQGNLYDLYYCHEDADGFRNGLLDWPNWGSANITLLKDSVTKSQIRTAIQNMGADADDVCVFFFAGHGTAGPDVYPYDEDDGYDEYLIPYDGLVWDSYWDEYDVDFDKCIRDDEFGNWMADLPTDKYAVFLDACNSGGHIRGLGKVRGIGDIVSAKGDGFAADLIAKMKTRDLNDNYCGVVVTACDDDETCVGSIALQHGVFTYCLLEGMGGPADDNYNDRISAEECYYYVYPCALNYYDQHAQMYDGHPGELEFLGPPIIIRSCEDCEPEDAYLGTIGTVPWDYSVSGNCGNGGKWVGQFVGEADATYHFDLCPDSPGSGTANFDADIKITNGSCGLIQGAGEDGSCSSPLYLPNDFQWTCTANGTYYVIIAPYNSYNSHTCGGNASHTFTLKYYIATPPDAPVLHSEPNITPGLRNTIWWDPVADANWYYAQCANDANFANVVTSSRWIGETNYTFTGLDLGQTYWYRVKATPQIESWSQTSQAEFQTDILVDAIATNDGDVVLAAGDVLAADTLGNANSNGTYSQQTILNVIECNENGLLTEIEMYLGIASSQTLQFVVYETPSESGGYGSYDLIHSNLITSGTGTGWYRSGQILVPLVAGKSYCIGVAWSGSSTFYCDFGTGFENISWGRKVSGRSIGIYPAPNSTSVIAYTGTSYYQNLITSGYSSSGSIVSTAINLPADGNWAWAVVRFDKTMPSDTALTIDVLNAADDSVILADVASGTELSGIAATSIKLRANLSTDDPNNNTPVLHDWSVSYAGPCESDWSNVESSRQCGTPGDFEPDCDVDIADLARLANEWLWTGQPGGIPEDIVQDGIVNFADFALLAQNWLAGVE